MNDNAMTDRERMFDHFSQECSWKAQAASVAALIGVLAIAGCGGYVPAPLTRQGEDAALATPASDVLAQRAAKLRHPRIPPMTLDFTRPLTPEELAVIAVLVNPELKAARAKAGVASAQVFDAGLLPDPQLALGLDHPVDAKGSLTNAYNVGISWDILGLLTRRAAVRAADATRRQVRYDIAWQEWSVAQQAKLLAERVAYLQRQLAVAQRAVHTASTLLEISRRNLQRHDIKVDEFALREVAYLDAGDRALSLARDLDKAHRDLNQNLGLAPDATLPLAVAPLEHWPTASAEALFATARDQRLDLLALQAGYSSQEEKLHQQLLARYPRVNLGFATASDTSNVKTIGLNVSISVPILNGNRGAVAIARATRAQLHDEYIARLYKTRADIAALVRDLTRIRAELVPLKRELPALTVAESRMREGVASGDITLLAYEAVRVSLFDKELKQLSLEQSAAEQVAALELAIGLRWSDIR